MDINRVKEAVLVCEETIKTAAEVYENAVMQAEQVLRESVNEEETTQPPSSGETVTVSAKKLADMEEKMQIMAKFIAENPHLNQS